MTAISTTKAPSKFDSYVSALGKVKNPRTDEALTILQHVATELGDVSEKTIKTAQSDVDDLTTQLGEARGKVDGLVTRRNRAIITAQGVGFPVRLIASTFGVSVGTVQKFADSRKLREALKVGGNANPPSVETLAAKVTNLPSGTKVADVVAHASKTGEILAPTPAAPAPKAPATAKATLTRAESLSDALATVVPTETDGETLAQLVRVLESALSRAKGLKVPTPKAAPTPKDVAPKANVAA